MNNEIIATIRLAQGEGGYYDELSRIHLTAGNPQRDIYAGTNCTQIRRSVKSGRLRLVFGSLGEEKKIDFGKRGNRFVAPETVEPVLTQVEETPVIEETIQETVEEVVENIEETIEESGVEEIITAATEETIKEATEEATEEVVEETVEETVEEKKATTKKAKAKKE